MGDGTSTGSKLQQSWIYAKNCGTNLLAQKLRPNWAIKFGGTSPGRDYFTYLFEISRFEDIFDSLHDYIYYQQIYFNEPQVYTHNPVHDGKILYYSLKVKVDLMYMAI